MERESSGSWVLPLCLAAGVLVVVVGLAACYCTSQYSRLAQTVV